MPSWSPPTARSACSPCSGAETPYRVLVEQMSEGALTVDEHGTILYANRRFAAMVRAPLERVTGSALASFVAADDVETLRHLLSAGRPGARELTLTSGGGALSAYVSVSPLPDGGAQMCVLVTDLTATEADRVRCRGGAQASVHADPERGHQRAGSTARSSRARSCARSASISARHAACWRSVDADGLHWTADSEYARFVPPIAGRHRLTHAWPRERQPRASCR